MAYKSPFYSDFSFVDVGVSGTANEQEVEANKEK